MDWSPQFHEAKHSSCIPMSWINWSERKMLLEFHYVFNSHWQKGSMLWADSSSTLWDGRHTALNSFVMSVSKTKQLLDTLKQQCWNLSSILNSPPCLSHPVFLDFSLAALLPKKREIFLDKWNWFYSAFLSPKDASVKVILEFFILLLIPTSKSECSVWHHHRFRGNQMISYEHCHDYAAPVNVMF